MKTLYKALSALVLAAVVTSGAFAQRVKSDWRWDDTVQWRRDLRLSGNQGSQISAINRRASMEVRRLDGQKLSGQERALRIRAIHARARQDILQILDDRQRSTLRNRGFDVMVAPLPERRIETGARRGPKPGHENRGKGGGHGRGKGG